MAYVVHTVPLYLQDNRVVQQIVAAMRAGESQTRTAMPWSILVLALFFFLRRKHGSFPSRVVGGGMGDIQRWSESHRWVM